MTLAQGLVAVLPVRDIDAAQTFFARLGFAIDADHGRYRLLADGQGGVLHLNADAGEPPAPSPFGLYLYRRDVDALAAAFADEMLGDGRVADREWGMYEFAVNGPDGVLVRVGWPTRLRGTQISGTPNVSDTA